MGKRIAEYYSEAESLGGLQAKIKLASITRIPSTRADIEPDHAETLVIFERAMGEVRTLFLRSVPQNTNSKQERNPAPTRAPQKIPGGEELLLGVLSSLHDALLGVYDSEGQCAWAWESKSLAKRYGFGSVNGALGDYVARKIAEEHGATIRNVYRRGETCQLESSIGFDTGVHSLSISLAPILDSGGKTSAVAAFVQDVSDRKQSEELLRQSEQRLREHNRVFLELVAHKSMLLGDLKETMKRVTEAAATTLKVARASVWLYDAHKTKIVCSDLYEKAVHEHVSGTELVAASFPAYFAALLQERTIAADNANTDPRTSEFSVPYLTPLGISSMLDVPIWANGIMAGVVCHEHVGAARAWTADEENFAYLMANFVALAMERGLNTAL